MVSAPSLQEAPRILHTKSTMVTRVASIDVIRALTMVLMIFVNDLGSLKNIPDWLEHVKPGVDGIGLADIVFPAFLFIVGLSLPFAVDHRRNKGDSEWQLLNHVLVRTIALLVMGVFLVNGETINETATGMRSYGWNSISCLSFILIWKTYPKKTNRYIIGAIKATGLITLLVLAFIYRGGEGLELNRFAPQWWGILGLIGWAYLAGGLITVFSRNNFWVILGGWIFFCLISMVNKAGYLPRESILSFIPDPILGGTLPGLTMGGVLIASIFRYYKKRNDHFLMTVVSVAFAALLIILSVITRPHWKLAKLGATPAWLFLCSAFTLLAFIFIYWIADVKNKAGWFRIIKPAGTDTLLCYLIPYFVYAILRASHFHWPELMTTGAAGLVKSLLVALFCVFITGILNRAGLRLKL